MPRSQRLIIAGCLLACLCLVTQARADVNQTRPSSSGNPELEHHQETALLSYVYIEPYEVRHEVLVRVRDLEAWMDPGLQGDEYIEVDELGPLLDRIAAFLLNQNPVRIDGKVARPVLELSSYVRHGLQGIELLAPMQRLELATAHVGVILTCSTDGLPQQVSIDWTLFSDHVRRVPVMTTDPAGARVSYVTPQTAEHTWSNFLKHDQLPSVQRVSLSDTHGEFRIPIGTLLCVLAMLPVGWEIYKRKTRGRAAIGPGVLVILLTSGAMFSWNYSPAFSITRPVSLATTPGEGQSAMLLQSLLKNIYLALNSRVQQDVFDKLALTVSDELLERLYLQHRQSFAVPREDGSTARIKQVTVQAASARQVENDSLVYEIHGQWSAVGTLGRWGDVLIRQNVYDARVTVAAVDGSWQVTGWELLEERQVEPGTQPAAGASSRM